MKKITVSILSVLMMLSMVFSTSVFAAEKTNPVADFFAGIFGAQTSDVSDVGVEYRGHVENKGDFPVDGTWIQGPERLGTVGEGLRLEAFWIKLAEDAPAGLHIKYQVHVQNKGWMGFVEDGTMAGTEGEGLRIEAIEIALVDDEGNVATGYSVEYRGHVQNVGDTEWYADGAQLGTTGSGLRLEALEIKIVQLKADMTAYNAAVAAAAALTETDYTAESWAALQTALTDNVVTEDNTQAEVDAATAAINAAIDGLVKVVKISDVVATAKDTFTVTFNAAIDPDVDTLTVKKGSVNVNLDGVTFSDDGLTGIITATSRFTEGTYTVTLTTADSTSSKTVDVEDETVAEIVVTTETAPLNPAPVNMGSPSSVTYVAKASIFAEYKVLNQYGEEMANQSITWSPSTGGDIADNATTGVLTIGNYDENTVFVPGATVYLTGVHAASGTVVNANVKVGLEAKEDKTLFKGIYDVNEDELVDTLPAGFEDGDYVLLYEVEDQYGNKIDNPDVSKLTFTSSNPLFVAAPVGGSATDEVITENDVDVTYQAVAIVRGANADKGGSATIQAISTLTGSISTYELSSEAKAAVKTFTMSAPADLIAETEEVEIPFTALDQFGNAIVDFDDLTGITFSPSSNLALEEKADGTAKLVYTAPNNVATEDVDYTAYITSLVTDGGNFSSLMLTIKEAAVPTTVAGLTADVTATLAQGGTETIDSSEIIVLDQYGRTIDETDVNDWLDTANNGIALDSVYAASGDVSPFTVIDNVATSDAERHTMGASTTVFTVTGKTATGLTSTEKFIFSLTTDNGTNIVSASSKSVTFTKANQSDFVSYEVTDLGTMYNDGVTGQKDLTHAVTVEAFGVKANGTKVAIPADQITTSAAAAVELAVGTSVIDDVTTGGYTTDPDFTNTDGTLKTFNVTITVEIEDDATGVAAAVIDKTLTLSNADPVVTTVEFDSDLVDEGAAFVEADNGTFDAADLAAVIDTTTLEDQYGVDITGAPAVPAITISGLTKVTDSTFTATNNSKNNVAVTGAKAGDKFTATFKYPDGASIACNFTVSDIAADSDITAPTFTATYPKAGAAQALASKKVELLVSANEAGTAYYVVVADGAAAPSAVQVMAGQNAAGTAALDSANAAILATTEKSFVTAALAADATAYDVYVVVEDAAGNTTAATKVDVTTPAAS